MQSMAILKQKIIVLLQESFQSAKEAIVSQKIRKQFQNKPRQVSTILAQIITDDACQFIFRPRGGEVLNNLLNLKKQENGKYYWDLLQIQDKIFIKNIILHGLVSTETKIMTSVASIVAIITLIQLPQSSQESSFIDNLTQNCTNQDLNVRVASFTTLSQICRLNKREKKSINQRLSQMMLGSLIIGTRQANQSIVLICLTAFQDSLQFFQNTVTKARYQSAILQMFENITSKRIYAENISKIMNKFINISIQPIKRQANIQNEQREKERQKIQENNEQKGYETWSIEKVGLLIQSWQKNKNQVNKWKLISVETNKSIGACRKKIYRIRQQFMQNESQQ